MIVDRVENVSTYIQQFPALAEAMELIQGHPDMAPGRHQIAGGYVMHQTGQTMGLEEEGFEAHRRYIDVQILVKGKETIFWNDIARLEESTPYDEESDKEMLCGNGAALEMLPGMFCVMFPSDAHAACRHYTGETPNLFEKFVVKLEIQR